MKNLSNGESDGLVLGYVKNKIVYPIALNEEELQMLDITLGMVLKEVKLINKPMGQAINLLKEKKDDKV